MPDTGEPTEGQKPAEGEGKTEETAGTEVDYRAEADKWKALSRKHEADAKANRDAAARLKEIEDADKSAIEKANERATVAEAKASEAELRAMRVEVGHEKGLSPSQARRLIGSTKEELEADADELLASFEVKPPKPGPAGRPRENLRAGSNDGEEPQELDPRKLAARIMGDK